jgi:hypothetical protein
VFADEERFAPSFAAVDLLDFVAGGPRTATPRETL